MRQYFRTLDWKTYTLQTIPVCLGKDWVRQLHLDMATTKVDNCVECLANPVGQLTRVSCCTNYLSVSAAQISWASWQAGVKRFYIIALVSALEADSLHSQVILILSLNQNVQDTYLYIYMLYALMLEAFPTTCYWLDGHTVWYRQ